MISRAVLKNRAKNQLKGYWGLAIITCFVYSIITQTMSIEVTNRLWMNEGLIAGLNILGLLLYGSISVGFSRFALNLATKKSTPKFTDLFSGFDAYFKSLITTILKYILIGIGTILLIIPGIIAMLMFSQTYYILAENPNLSAIECMRKSAKMMRGHKWELFVLGLSFIGWLILCIFTLGIGILWYTPYYEITMCNFYLELKERHNE